MSFRGGVIKLALVWVNMAETYLSIYSQYRRRFVVLKCFKLKLHFLWSGLISQGKEWLYEGLNSVDIDSITLMNESDIEYIK